MALCCDAELHDDGTVNGEPTEAALVAWANNLGYAKPVLKGICLLPILPSISYTLKI